MEDDSDNKIIRNHEVPQDPASQDLNLKYGVRDQVDEQDDVDVERIEKVYR